MKNKYLIMPLLFLSWLNVQASQKLVGKIAPSFTGKAVFPDGSVQEFDMKNYPHQNMVLYFYPMDNTPGCTKQAKKFRDDIAVLQDNNIMVVGISYDSIASHLAFQKKYMLPYPLLSDSNHRISKMYKTAGYFSSTRTTFLINQQGIIFKVFDKVDIKNQIHDILDAFKK